MAGAEADPAKLPLAAYVAVTLSVPMGRSIDAAATPLVSVEDAAAMGVMLPDVV